MTASIHSVDGRDTTGSTIATEVRETTSGVGVKVDTGVPTVRHLGLGSADAEGHQALFRAQQEMQRRGPEPLTPSPLAVFGQHEDLPADERARAARQRYAESASGHVTGAAYPEPAEAELSPAPIDVFRRLTDEEQQRVEEVRNRENVQRLEAENRKAREAKTKER